jgi:hypothetical protein
MSDEFYGFDDPDFWTLDQIAENAEEEDADLRRFDYDDDDWDFDPLDAPSNNHPDGWITD